MDNNIEVSEINPAVESVILRLAESRANNTKWDVNILVFLFTILISIIILISLNIDTFIVAMVAVVGLGLVLLFGNRRSKSLVRHYYAEEVGNLQQGANNELEYKDKGNQITAREKEVLSYVAQGFSNKMIASQLGISTNTVKIFMSRLMEKLEANDRTEAVVIAIRNKIISIQ
ncbi:response regulator transcription factor [Chloroflexota bacterium]